MSVRVLDFADGFTSSAAPSEGSFIDISTSSEEISASGTITLLSGFDMIIKIEGDGSAVTASTTPFGVTPPGGGTVIRLIGQDATNTVTISHNDAENGCILNGNATLGLNDILSLYYDADAERYIELNRNF
jgi:hypothetical protein